MVRRGRRLVGRWESCRGPFLVASSTRISFCTLPCDSCGRPPQVGSEEEAQMLEPAQDNQDIIERVAALDIGKAELTCCVRVPGPNGRRVQEVTTHPTMTRSLQVLADRLRELGVTRVVMEATSDYWRPP